jgi:hypothetical protein
MKTRLIKPAFASICPIKMYRLPPSASSGKGFCLMGQTASYYYVMRIDASKVT